MKYRGLRSLNASIWDQPSDEAYRPEIWDQLCSASKLRSLRARSERVKADSGFLPGSQVRIRIRNVPTHVRHSLQSENVLFMSTLLPGEDEHSACNVKMTLNPDCPRPIVAKEQIIMQCGQRRMIIEPLFPKMERLQTRSIGSNASFVLVKRRSYHISVQCILDLLKHCSSFNPILLWGSRSLVLAPISFLLWTVLLLSVSY